MTFTNKQLSDIRTGLADVSNSKTELSTVVSYRIIKNKLAAENALAAYYEMRDSIIKKYSGGKPVVNYEDNPDAYNAVLAEVSVLDKETVDVDIAKVTLDDLADTMSPYMMSKLMFMVE